MAKRNKNSYLEILRDIKKRYKPGTLDCLVALVDSIDDAEALRREKITVADYRSLIEIKKDMTDLGGGADFIMSSLKDFFERHGFHVSQNKDGISWYVTCKEEP